MWAHFQNEVGPGAARESGWNLRFLVKSLPTLHRVMKRWSRVVAGAIVFSLSISQLFAEEPPPRLVTVDKTTQTLRAYDGDQLVLETHVSTGRYDRSTPNGHFSADDKYPVHYSRLYHHAPMPYSVQINGNVFIHGFSYVPAWPDSHGCIRVPIDGDNPAKRFYEWVSPGTPVEIFGQWNGGGKSRTSHPRP